MSARPAVAVLGLSPALDLTLRVPALEPGLSHRAAPAGARLGGKGVNVARVLARIGIRAVVHGPVAREHWEEPAGEDREDRSAPLDWALTPSPAPLRRSIAVVEDAGRATLVNESSHPHPVEVWTRLRADLEERLADPDLHVLVVSGSTPADLPEDLLPGLIASAHAAAVDVVVDTSGHGLLAAARAGADWVKPNEEELRALDAGAADDLLGAAQRLVRAGAGSVLLSRGAAGLVVVDDSGPRRAARLERTLQGNPTGAGDAAVAALAASLAEARRQGTRTRGPDRLSDDEITEILVRAVALSASAVLMPQAGEVPAHWSTLRAQVLIDDLESQRQRNGVRP